MLIMVPSMYAYAYRQRRSKVKICQKRRKFVYGILNSGE